ncbi:MAG: acyl-CoA dehydrogenase [Candidatus Marinimicrobia bacterium]|nr:acyl-CoA dehydrogenase [Candidatus Neomarinimicrobiota bacterium]
MDFNLSEDHIAIRKTLRDFAETEIAPGARERDENSEFPAEIVKKLAQLGMNGVCSPIEYGGSGLDYLSFTIIIEELARIDASVAVIISVTNTLAGFPLKRFGTDEQKKKYLTPLSTGEKLGAYSLSEAQAGSDASNLACMAVRDGDDYVLNGVKNFVTNGGNADIIILFAMTDKEKGKKGISTFIIEKEMPGVSVGKIEKKLGIRSSDTVELVFEECRVPAANRLGEEGEGFKIAMTTLDYGRVGIGAQALGIAQGAMERAIAYSLEREQFGKKINEFQAIQFKISDMAVEIDATRLLLYRAAWMQDRGENFTAESAMAKLFASQTAMKTANQAVQIFGGYGYMREFEIERFMRDAKITEIYEGTSEIQKIVIARETLRKYGNS